MEKNALFALLAATVQYKTTKKHIINCIDFPVDLKEFKLLAKRYQSSQRCYYIKSTTNFLLFFILIFNSDSIEMFKI